MIQSLLSMPQSAVSWFWGGVVNTISMPWRASLAVILAVYAFRLGGPWLLRGILWLVRGICWTLMLIEGLVTSLLKKAGIEQKKLLSVFSEAVYGLGSRSQSWMTKLKASGKKRRPLHLRWVLLAATVVAAIFFYALPNHQEPDVVPPSLAWWHSFEHFLLSGTLPSGQQHLSYPLPAKGNCLTNSDCLLGEALRTGKASEAELRLDNPDQFPSQGSVWFLERLHPDWIKYSQQTGFLKELLPSPTPAAMKTPVTILIPARDKT